MTLIDGFPDPARSRAVPDCVQPCAVPPGGTRTNCAGSDLEKHPRAPSFTLPAHSQLMVGYGLHIQEPSMDGGSECLSENRRLEVRARQTPYSKILADETGPVIEIEDLRQPTDEEMLSVSCGDDNLSLFHFTHGFKLNDDGDESDCRLAKQLRKGPPPGLNSEIRRVFEDRIARQEHCLTYKASRQFSNQKHCLRVSARPRNKIKASQG